MSRSRPSPRRRRRRAVVVGALALGLAACTPDAPEDAGRSTTDVDRIEAVRQARDVVAGPAEALGTAAAEVVTRLDQLVERPDRGRLDGFTAATTDLADAVDTGAGLELAPDTPDVRAAADALATALDGARAATRAAEQLDAAVERVLATDEPLRGFVASWDEPGARSELLARFEDVATSAETLAADLADAAPEACPGPVQRRHDAAAHVAEATRELRELVEQRDGDGFDARRAELADAPFGVEPDGTSRGPGTAVDPATCPAVAEVQAGVQQVEEALAELEQALNPTDLSS